MKAFLALLLTAAALFQTAAAHYRFTKLIVNGAAYVLPSLPTTNPPPANPPAPRSTAEYQYVRRNTNANSPVSTTSPDLRCNTGAGASSGASTSTATVAAGATVGFAMDQAIFHVGPLLVYMAKAPGGSAAAFDGGSGWFKIFQVPPVFAGGQMTWPNTDGG